MGIKSIRIKNLLSFDNFIIDDIKDINCIVGRNNTGKTNLLKLIDYFYSKLNDEQKVAPELFSNFSPTGSITITFDTTRVKHVVSSKKNRSDYQKYIYKSLFKSEHIDSLSYMSKKSTSKREFYDYTITLTINKNGSIFWSDKDPNVKKIIKRIFPFYSVDTRRLDLYNWSKLWNIVSELKFLNAKDLKRDEHIDYINSNISPKSDSYKDYIEKISDITKTSPYDYQDLILNYIKVGLDGHTFNIDGNQLDSQSDGTNSHKYLELFLSLMIALTRREYIYPTIYIDEPEIGLHPKRNEELIQNLFNTYSSYKSDKSTKEIGKYSTPNPCMIFSTHSPNIVKMVIKLFSKKNEHKILHITKKNKASHVKELNSHYDDNRFLNVFSDNEARLFFSKFILFVEGETELEIFGNLHLNRRFKNLRDIDVYRTNEVMLKAINPSNSNLSIPYLILYDADKMISVNNTTGALSFKNREVDLFEIKKSLRFSIFGTRNYKDHKSIGKLLDQHEKAKNLSPSKAEFTIFKYTDFIKRVNKLTINHSRKYIASTTIEGSIINENSLALFIKWIISEFRHNVFVGGKGDTSKRLTGLSKAYKQSGKIKSTYYGVFANPRYTGTLSNSQIKFTKKIKRLFLNNVVTEIKEKELSSKELVIIFRLLFEGKTDTLISCENNAYSAISQEMKNNVDAFKFDYMKSFPCKFSKTGGWVTNFLNFSLENMERCEQKDKNNTFKSQFKHNFPELYDIVEHVSSSIE